MKATLTFLGRASIKLKTSRGSVTYIDPYAGKDYAESADLILVTHSHGDHNRVNLVTQNPGCRTITWREALIAGSYKSFSVLDFSVQAVPAYNKNHKREETVGYLIGFDGLLVYHASDTSKIPEMAELSSRGIDYALLPTDGHYNMGIAEAAEVSTLIKAKRTIPIHSDKDADWSETTAKAFTCPGKLIVRPGESVEL